MADNVAVKITAEVIDLQQKFAIAKAESQALTRELNALAREAAKGGGGPELQAGLLQAAAAATTAQREVKGLSTELKAVQGSTSMFGGAVKSLNAALAPLAGMLAAGMVVRFGEQLVQSAADIQHQADVLGMSTTAYQDFSVAALTAGVSTDAVDTALKRFNNSLGAAQMGSKAQAEAFEKLGVDADQPAEDALPKLAKALLTMSNAGDRAHYMQLLFSRSGQEMIPVLKQWAEGTDALTDKLSDQGLIMDHDLVKAAHDSTIEMDKAFLEMKVSLTPAAVAASNALAFLADNFHYVRDAALTLDGVDLSYFKRVAAQAQAAAKASDKADQAVRQAVDHEAEHVSALDGLDAKLREREDLTNGIAQAQLTLNEATKKGDAEGIAKASEVIADLKREMKALDSAGKEATAAAKKAGADQIETARTKVAEINTIEGLGSQERLKEQQEVWQQLLRGERLTTDQQKAVRRELANTTAAIEREEAQAHVAAINDELAHDRALYEQKKGLLDQEVAAGRMTKQEELRNLVQALNDMEALELKAIADKEKLYAHDALNYARTEAEKVAITDKYNAEIAALVAKLTAQEAKDQFDLQNELLQGERTLVNDMLHSRKGLAASLFQIGEKMVEDWIVMELKQLTVHLMTEAQKLLATTAGAQAQVAVQAAAKAEGMAADVAIGSAQIMNDAAKAASGAYSAVVGIPYVGPILAPIAAGVAFTAVAAFDSLTSAEGGQMNVPGGFYQLHKEEAVMPASIANPMREFFKKGGAGTRDGDTHVHIHAVDALSFQQLLMRNGGGAIIQLIKQAVRNGAALSQS